MNVSLPDNDPIARLTDLRVGFKCRKCGKSWGVKLNDALELPPGWNICRGCNNPPYIASVEKDVRHDYAT